MQHVETYQGVTLAELKENLTYNPDSGKLYWRKPGKGRKAGVPVGTKNHGYLTVLWNQSVTLKIHRIAFWMHNGYLPELVDHANRNKLDNRADNLREATVSNNGLNRKRYATNTSGYRWVKLDGKRWRWDMVVRGVRSGKGGYLTPEAAYLDASAMHIALAKEFSPLSN